MLKQPINFTVQERNAVRFGVELLTKYGYGYTIRVPFHQLASELTKRGRKISFMTIIAYWNALERIGYVTREIGARKYGTTFRLNRHAFQKHIG